uniref:Secreted protein n=1 Tax=Steinernema glaseri TaxID=37863 RepID=A0A1I7Z8S8_9BILA
MRESADSLQLTETLLHAVLSAHFCTLSWLFSGSVLVLCATNAERVSGPEMERRALRCQFSFGRSVHSPIRAISDSGPRMVTTPLKGDVKDRLI